MRAMDVEFEETTNDPICPFCEHELRIVHYKRQKLSFGFMRGFSWVILLMCPHCRKVLGTQAWD